MASYLAIMTCDSVQRYLFSESEPESLIVLLALRPFPVSNDDQTTLTGAIEYERVCRRLAVRGQIFAIANLTKSSGVVERDIPPCEWISIRGSAVGLIKAVYCDSVRSFALPAVVLKTRVDRLEDRAHTSGSAGYSTTKSLLGTTRCCCSCGTSTLRHRCRRARGSGGDGG